MSRGSLTFGAIIAVAAMALTACQSVDQDAIAAQALACPEGSDCFDPVRPVGEGGSLTVEMGEFFIEITDGVAIEGSVTVKAINVGDVLHNFRIDSAAGETKKVEPDAGETVEGVLELFAGEYTYYCDVPGHRSAGMEGTLVVYASEEEARAAGALDDDEVGTNADSEASESPSEG